MTSTFAQLPAPTGGSIPEGVYDAVLQALRIGTSVDGAAWTIEVRGREYAWVSLIHRANPLQPDFEDRARGELTVSGTTVAFKRSCGGTGTRVFDYSATDDQLTLHEEGLLLRFKKR